MKLLNFSHPLTAQIIAAIEKEIGQNITDLRNFPVKFDSNQPFAVQVSALVEQIGFSSEEWQTTPMLINPPAHSPIALTLLAELHGRMGYFPAVIRLKPVQNATPPQFEFAEMINLQAIRDTARKAR